MKERMMEFKVKPLVAELVGTFWLVLGGCGAAVLAADFGVGGNGTSLGIGFVGVSLAFGLSVLTGAYALGHISGGHFNPAVTLGMVVAGRFDPKHALGYVGAQVVGGIIGAAVIFGIANGQAGFEIGEGAGVFASNGYGDFSPDGYGLGAALLAEVVLTAVFLVVILGATSKKAAPAMGGLAIGLALTLIHLVSIPVTNTSVNPARSTSQALFAGSDQMGQLWLFWVAPLIGAALGAGLHRYVLGDSEDVVIGHDPSRV
jgi:aquaporin Z